MPSGYPELMLASQMIDEPTANRLMRHHKLSKKTLEKELETIAPAVARMRQSISSPPEYTERTIDDEKFDLMNLLWAMSASLDLAQRLDSPEMKVRASVDYLLVTDILSRSGYAEAAQFYPIYELWECRQQLSRDQAIGAATMLWEVDGRRMPWQAIERYLKLNYVNSGWEYHLHSLLDDWTGYDRFSSDRSTYLTNVAQMRVL